MTLPGVPGVILGRNRDLAWGCTNVHDDGADLYVEEFDPRDPDRYRVGDGWESVTVRRESIRVRDGALSSSWRTVEHPVRVTRHGPLVEIRGRLYALRWTALEDAVELPAFAGAGRARGWDEFKEALRQYPGPSQNFVYADRDGPHRLVLRGPPADTPRRRTDRGPTRARRPTATGSGTCPSTSCPTSWIPRPGMLVTANNRLVGTDYPHRVTRGGIGPWRATALLESLEARDGMDGRRHGAPAGRAPVDPAPRPGARAARGGGPPSRRRGMARGRARR